MTIHFRDVRPSPAVEADIREKAAKLEEVFDRITSLRVVVGQPHRRHRHGALFHVGIDLRVPGREIVVNRDPAAHHAYEDLHVAIRDAFDDARRQLQDYAKQIRGRVNGHATDGSDGRRADVVDADAATGTARSSS